MIGRRGLLGLALIGTAAASARAQAQSAPPPARSPQPGTMGLDATHFGLRPGTPDDQSRRLQEALVEASRRNSPLMLPPGRYRASNVILPEGARLIGVPGATQLDAAQAGPILIARRIRRAAVEGLALDGMGIRGAERAALIHGEDIQDLTVNGCDLRNGGVNGATLVRAGGRVSDCRFSNMRDTGLFSLDSRGLLIERNQLEDMGNNAIQLWRGQAGEDNSQIRANRIQRVRIDGGGDGPNGNGIVLFRAGGVIVEGNTLRDCALTFVRNNSGSSVQIIGNNGRRCGEVAYYSEFAFEGAVIANNIAEDCAQGINITNLDHGGRLAVCSGNMIRRVRKGLAPRGTTPIGGFGIHVEAEAAVTGNVIEEVSDVGISLGWSWGMRNLVATGNMIRDAAVGIGVSLVPQERNVVISNNVIAGAKKGAVVGYDHHKPVTGDLTRVSDRRAAGVRVEGNAAG